MKLTAKAVQRLRYNEAWGRQHDVKDDGTPGLYVRLYPSGRRNWIYRYQLNSSTRRKTRIITMGQVSEITDSEEQRRAVGALTLSEARDRANGYAGQVRNNEDPAAALQRARAERRAMPTVEEFADEYVKRHAKPHKVRWREDQQMLNNWVIPEIGRLKMSDVRRRDIVAILDKIRDAGHTRMPGKVLAVTRKMFNFAIERGVLETTPVQHVSEKQGPPAQRAMPEKDIRDWWEKTSAALKAEEPTCSRACALALRLLLLTGQRPGEVAGIRVSELDLENAEGAVWNIPGERRKRGKPHAVALTAEAVAVIEQALAEVAADGVLFPNGLGQPVRIDSGLTRSMIQLWGKGVQRPTPHAARHTVATELEALQFDELEIGRVLGHQSQSVTGRVYINRRGLAAQRRALEAWERRLLEIVEQRTKTADVVPLR